MGVIRNPLILGVLSALEWACYRSANRCVALSPGIADGIARRGFSRGRIALVPNGCDHYLFGTCAAGPWRPQGVAPDDFLAIYTGTHGQANGLGAVLDAAAELKWRGRENIKLLLVGEGKLKPGLMARARQESLDNVIFHDPVDKGRLAGLMAAADIGMQCLSNVPAFYYGTSPNKFFDYIAAGIPVLNNYPGWLADMIVEHDCGFAVPPDNPAAFADALEAAAADRATLKKRGKKARQLASTSFARDLMADRWVAWVTAGLRE
jgi:glycosyltransferase involved in cell wall biosynthesis